MRLWKLAKPTVRRGIGPIWAAGVAASEVLVVVGDRGGIGGKILKQFFSEHLVADENEEAPMVAVLVGVQRHRMFEGGDEGSQFFASLEPNEVGLMVLDCRGKPFIAAVEMAVLRERMH